MFWVAVRGIKGVVIAPSFLRRCAGKRVAIAPSACEDESDVKGWRLHRAGEAGIARKRVVIAP